MSSADVIAIVSAAATVLIAVLGYILSQKNKKIELLEAKNEALEKTNRTLELNNLRLEIVGKSASNFFQQLPRVVENSNRSEVESPAKELP